jgi:hypothetical protein
LLGVAYILSAGAAQAADLGNKHGGISDLVPVAEVGSGSWTGPWFGGYAAHAIVETMWGSNDGQYVAPALGFDLQTGKVVIGGEVSYGWAVGDAADFTNNVLELTGRIGFLPTKSLLIYGHGGWGRVFFDGGDVDFWQFGPDAEFRPADKGFSLDMRYGYVIPDQVGIPDVNAHVFKAGLKYRF